jgi:hypothetical protein
MIKMIKCGGRTAKLVVRRDTEKRLKKTCFRGTDQSYAGNFCMWPSVDVLFGDQLVLKLFSSSLALELTEKATGTVSFTIVYSSFVGWSSTAPLKHYDADELESFKLNRSCIAKRVLKTANREANLTRDITFVCELKKEEGAWVAVIHSIYPGRDIGELKGEITSREKVVFFDWTHSGSPIRM